MFRFVYFLIFFCATATGFASGSEYNAEDTELKVLFVGNSYTYFWNLPQMVEAMAKSQGVSIIARKSTAGGTNWKQHWEGDKNLKTVELIKEGQWDIVVLQNHSMSTVDYPEQFMDYGSRLIELVKSTGAKPVLFETWSRDFNPLMINDIKKSYYKLAEQHNIEVVKVGEIWNTVRGLRAELDLHDPDKSHPSTIGTYLNACIFYSYLTGNKVSGLNHRITKLDQDGELLYLAIMDENDAHFLHQVVDSFNEIRSDE